MRIGQRVESTDRMDYRIVELYRHQISVTYIGHTHRKRKLNSTEKETGSPNTARAVKQCHMQIQ